MKNFQLSILCFTLQAIDPIGLPEYEGSMFRGGFGHALRSVCCSQGAQQCQTCVSSRECAYAYLFETMPPQGATHFAKNAAVPRPYLFVPHDNPKSLAAGDAFHVSLTLFGKALDYLPFVVVALGELGSVGITASRHRYRLAGVSSLNPLSGARGEVLSSDNVVRRKEVQVMTWDDVERAALGLNPSRLALDLVSPTRVKWQGKYLTDELPFSAFVQTLTLRVNALNMFHCSGVWHGELANLRVLADGVANTKSNVKWKSLARWSSRQGKKDTLSGLIGETTYEGDLVPFRQMLVLGQFTHVGSDCVFGCGKYKILADC